MGPRQVDRHRHRGWNQDAPSNERFGPVVTGAFFAAYIDESDAAPCCQMIKGPQIKAARALLGWRVRDLGRHAAMDTADVQDVEDGTLQKRRFKNAEIIQATLEGAGIEFIDDVGVQFRPKGLEGMADDIRDQDEHKERKDEREEFHPVFASSTAYHIRHELVNQLGERLQARRDQSAATGWYEH
jgi:hypothetical protein